MLKSFVKDVEREFKVTMNVTVLDVLFSKIGIDNKIMENIYIYI